jgi:hypothetical protein
MFVLTIVAILACASIPALWREPAHVVRQHCVDEWTEVLRYTRMQALLRQRPLSVYPLAEHNWALGVRVQQDDTVLREWTWHHPVTRLIWHGFRTSKRVIVDYDLARLAMNGFFNIEHAGKVLSPIVVTRLGRIV